MDVRDKARRTKLFGARIERARSVYWNEEQPYIHYTKDRLSQRELEWLNPNAVSGVQLVSASDCVNLQSHNRQLELATPDKPFTVRYKAATPCVCGSDCRMESLRGYTG
jgi:hypothetical protein